MRPWQQPNVRWIALTSLMNDAAGEMVAPFIPAYLTGVLKAAPAWVGLVEGASDATSSLLKLVAGRLSDRTGRHRPFVIAGYAIAGAIRPLMAFVTAPAHVLAIRTVDRIGKGIRSSPRDAILADSVPPEQRGSAYGFHRAMDNLGAVVGPLLAIVALQALDGNLQRMFLLAAIPGFLSILFAFRIRDAGPVQPSTVPRLGPPSRDLMTFLLPLALFALGKAGESMMLLRAGGEEVSLVRVPLMWVVYNGAKSLGSTPLGMLSDRLGHRRTLLAAWSVYAAVAVLAASIPGNGMGILLVYALYGALSEGVEKAYVADLSPSDRGTAFGWYYLVSGVGALAGSTMLGLLWTQWGQGVAFGVSAVTATFATLFLLRSR